MAFRIAQALVLISLAAAQAQTLEYPVRHKRLGVDCGGRLLLEDNRISYQGLCGKGDKKQRLEWNYGDAQKLELYANRVVLRGYRDRKWLAGADEVYDFRLEGKVDINALYLHLRARMDDRLVARVPFAEGNVLWRIPAKLPAAWMGAQGELALYPWGLVFESGKYGASRTWRDSDILNVNSTEPREFSVQTTESEFVFQLKRRLHPSEYSQLWFRLNRPKGLELIQSSKGDVHQ